MRKVLILLYLLIFFNSQSQKLTYQQTKDITFASNFSNGNQFPSYQSMDGSEIKLGDTLIIGNPTFNPNLFTAIWLGKYSIGGALLSPPKQANGSVKKLKVVVDNIFVYHSKVSRQSELLVYMHLRVVTFSNKGGGYLSVANYDRAIELGELINPNRPLTREEAIKKLKETKDLLDLGMVSQSRYDSIKAKLTPIIMNGKQ